jgi:A/G-specific adenine glycosylase
VPERSIDVLVVRRDGAILFEKRPPAGIWAGLWSLPEAPAGTDPVAEVSARFGLTAQLAGTLAPIRHAFTHFALTLNPRRLAVESGPVRAEAPRFAWLPPDAARSAGVPAPIAKLLRMLDGAAAVDGEAAAPQRATPAAQSARSRGRRRSASG